MKASPRHGGAQHSKWSLSPAWMLHLAAPRLANDSFELITTGVHTIALADRQNGLRRHFQIEIQPEDRLLFAGDGTKLVVARKANSHVYYFGSADAPKIRRRIDTRIKVGGLPQAEAIRKALADKRLCAFVYAPVTNPLTNQVVGASRDNRLKGILRFLSWNDTSAEVVVQEEFQPMKPDDIVSILHVWEQHTPKEFFDYAVPDWWTVLGDAGDTNVDGVPAAKEMPPLGIDPNYLTRAEPYGIHFQEVESREQRDRRLAAAVTAAASTPPISIAPQAPSADDLQELERFLQEHHAKSSRGDINGLMADYALMVDHQGAGRVTLDAIRKEELEYHAPGYRVSERMRGAPQFRRLSPNVVEAKYELGFVRAKPDGSWISGVADVVLNVHTDFSGRRIVKQQSTSRENEKRRGDRNPPSL